MLPLTSIPSQDQREKWSHLADVLCVTVVGLCVVEGFVSCRWERDFGWARICQGRGYFLGGREIGENLEYFLPLLTQKEPRAETEP